MIVMVNGAAISIFMEAIMGGKRKAERVGLHNIHIVILTLIQTRMY